MPEPTNYNNILVPLDGSELAECVLPHVEIVARGCHTPTITLIRVVESYFLPAAGEADDGGHTFTGKEHTEIEIRHEGEAFEYLRSIARRLVNSTCKVKYETVPSDDVAEAIAQYAEKEPVDLVVLSSHGRSGINRLWWGSITDKLLHRLCVPLTVVRAPGCTLQ